MPEKRRIPGTGGGRSRAVEPISQPCRSCGQWVRLSEICDHGRRCVYCEHGLNESQRPDGTWEPATPMAMPRHWPWLQRIINWLRKRSTK